MALLDENDGAVSSLRGIGKKNAELGVSAIGLHCRVNRDQEKGR